MVRNLLQTYQAAYSGLPREVWYLSLALFVNRVGTMVLPFLTLYLTEELNYSEASAGSLTSIYGLGAIAGTYIGGRLTQRLGAVPLQALFLSLAVPFYLVLPWIESWWGIAGCLVGLSLFAEGVRPASATAVTQYAKPGEQTRALALQRMAVNLAVSFGSLLGGYLAKWWFFLLFLFDSVTSFCCAVFLVVIFGVFRSGSPHQAAASTPPQSVADSGAGTRATNRNPTNVGPQANLPAGPASDPLFWVYLLLIALGSIVFFQFMSTYPLYLRDHCQISKPQYGWICAINTLMIVAFEMILIERARKWPLMLTIGWGLFLSCLGFGLLPFSQHIGWVIFSMIVLTIGEMLWMPLSLGWVAQRSQAHNRGLYMGWYSMTMSVSFVLGPWLGTTLYSFDPDWVWYCSLAVGVLLWVAMPQLARWEQRPGHEVG